MPNLLYRGDISGFRITVVPVYPLEFHLFAVEPYNFVPDCDFPDADKFRYPFVFRIDRQPVEVGRLRIPKPCVFHVKANAFAGKFRLMQHTSFRVGKRNAF